MKITEDDTRHWLGTSNPMAEAIEVITSVANGEYTPENLKQDIADISEYYDAETFESQYAGGFGSGSLSDVGLSTNQLTSTWGSGDFDSASLNSSLILPLSILQDTKMFLLVLKVKPTVMHPTIITLLSDPPTPPMFQDI